MPKDVTVPVSVSVGVAVSKTTRSLGSAESATAMVEEIQTKVYDTAKARMLTLLEVATGNDKGNLGTSSAGRMLGYLLEDVKETIIDVARRRGVDVSPAALEEAQKEREKAARESAKVSIEHRKWVLEQELDDLRRKADRYHDEIRKDAVVARIGALSAKDLKHIEETLSKLGI